MLHSEVSGDWEIGWQDRTCDNSTPLDVHTEDEWLSPDDGQAIVVGAGGILRRYSPHVYRLAVIV